MIRFLSALVVAVFLALPLSAQEGTGPVPDGELEAAGSAALSDADARALAELRQALVDAIEAGDAAAYASLCTEDVKLLHPGSPIINGSEPLHEHNAEMFAAVDVTSLDLAPVEIYGTGDLAYEVGTQVLAIDPEVPGFSSSRKYVHVLRKGEDGRWRFAVLMSSDNK